MDQGKNQPGDEGRMKKRQREAQPGMDNWPRWRARLHEVIFEADTPVGKLFDVLLMGSIVVSVAAVMLDSIAGVRQRFGPTLAGIEWFFTLLFSVEYVLRLISVGRPWRYARSFYGLVDLLAVIPTYLSLVLPGSRYLLVIRVLRILRIFRILKLVQYLDEARLLVTALKASARKITVFLFTVLTLVSILGSLMYVVEGEAHGFTSIPRAIYWTIVTLTTVGYGDISPQTPLGQLLASVVMVLGYGIIAVPTGIVTVQLSDAYRKKGVTTQACPACGSEGHDPDAVFCKFCGAPLMQEETP